MLQKLGRTIYRNPWQTIAVWIVALAVLGGVAATQFKEPSSAITIPGTAANAALDDMNRLFPEAGSGSARVALKAPAGKDLDDFKNEIESSVAQFAKIEGVKQAISPFLNPAAINAERDTAILQIQLTNGVGSVDQSVTDAVKKQVDVLASKGITAHMSGDIIQKAPAEIIGIGEVVGLVIAALVLVAVFRSLRFVGVPLAVAVLTVGVAMAGLFSLAQVVDISATTPVLAVMLGLAVGIDYSLFIANKYLRLVRDKVPHEDAAAMSIATAGNAVLFAAATVVIALAALSVVNIPFMTTMGLAGAATIALAGIVAVTLVPAMLGIIGTKIPSKALGGTKTHKQRHKTAYAWVAFVTKRPLMSSVTVIAAVGVLAWPITSLQLGLPSDKYASEKSTENKSYKVITEGFGEGYNNPMAVVVEGLPVVTQEQRQGIKAGLMAEFKKQVAEQEEQGRKAIAAQLQDAKSPQEQLAIQQQVKIMKEEGEKKKAEALKQIESGSVELAKRLHLSKIAEKIASLSGVESAQAALALDSGSAGVIQVIPKAGPFDQSTADVISTLREKDTQKKLSDFNGISYGVTGSVAMQIDINQKLADALPVYLAVVVGLSLAILLLAFRSIWVPVKATLGFILSVTAMFGALVAVFQWGWFGIAEMPAPIISFIPIIATGILFGLAMDYEFFLVSSMHEAHAEGMDAKKAVVEGFSHSARVVVAAAVIMIAVFGGFITNHDVTVQAIGFGLALGIAVDAFLVRLTLVPAVMTLMGKGAWWLPKWLDALLPHVSVEGKPVVEDKKK